MTSLVRAAVLTNYLEVARHAGLNPQNELALVDLNQAFLKDPDHFIPMHAAVELLELSAAHSKRESFGLLMAESRHFSDLGAVSLLLSHQPNLRHALQMVLQYRHLLNHSLAIYLEDVDDLVIIREELVMDRPIACRQAMELALGVMARMCASLLGPAWRPLAVHFTHEAPQDVTVHRRVFGCKSEFNAKFNGIVCKASAFDAPNPNADPAMARYAQRFVDSLRNEAERTLVHEVRTAIYVLLPMGRATIEQVAQALAMNVRTLQRRLEENDANFSDLINEIRRDLVQRYMFNPSYSLARIGELLGYSLPSSFTRWFTLQFNSTPAAWRSARVKSQE